MNENQKNGFWAIATRKHLKEFVDYSENMDELDDLNVAGKSGLFLGAIRGNKNLNKIDKIEKMASQVGIKPNELHKIILPQLETSSKKQVELIKDKAGYIIGIEEYIFDTKSTLDITGTVFEDLHPSDKERIAVIAMEETKKVPYKQDEIVQIMVDLGYNERDTKITLDIAHQYKLLRKLESKNNPIISNEYIWGTNNHKIARAIGELGKIQKESLGNTIEEIQQYQGIPLDKLTIADNNIFNLAKKIGMINPISIVTNRNLTKEFEFTQNSDCISGPEDIFDDVKLLLASIRFGENYTKHSTIFSAQRFLKAWISNGEVGPHDANNTDYIMLEKKGIARVEHKSKSKLGRWGYYNATGYYLILIKKDVAEEALKIINGLLDDNDYTSDDSNYDGIITTTNYRSSEVERIRMGEISESSKDTDEYIQKILRDEMY